MALSTLLSSFGSRLREAADAASAWRAREVPSRSADSISSSTSALGRADDENAKLRAQASDMRGGQSGIGCGVMPDGWMVPARDALRRGCGDTFDLGWGAGEGPRGPILSS